MQKIIILDFGSQTTQLIGRRVRELDTFCEIMPYNKYPEDDPKFDSLGGFIMIKAPKLEYSAIMKALENGDFYLIGCTTANPLISLNPAIRSRTRLLETEPLTSDDILIALKRAVSSEKGLGNKSFSFCYI